MTLFKKEYFQNPGKKRILCLRIKKESKVLTKSHIPIILVPLLGKTFKLLIFDDLFNHFFKSKLFTKCQSAFLPDDSCICHLLCTAHKINLSFNCALNFDVRGVFLEIIKAFHKFWHQGLLCKLESYGIKEKLLNLLTKHFFYISNLVANAPDLNLGKKLSNLFSNHEAFKLVLPSQKRLVL